MRYAILNGAVLRNIVEVEEGADYAPPTGATMREATPQDEADLPAAMARAAAATAPAPDAE